MADDNNTQLALLGQSISHLDRSLEEHKSAQGDRIKKLEALVGRVAWAIAASVGAALLKVVGVF